MSYEDEQLEVLDEILTQLKRIAKALEKMVEYRKLETREAKA